MEIFVYQRHAKQLNHVFLQIIKNNAFPGETISFTLVKSTVYYIVSRITKIRNINHWIKRAVIWYVHGGKVIN